MDLFNKKTISKCNILERYNIDIEQFVAHTTSNLSQKEYCRLLGETNKYNIYLFKDTTTSHEHLLRQDKHNLKRVVYLGRSQDFNCVFGNSIFLMYRTSAHILYAAPLLICIDIETGKQTTYNILSKENIFQLIGGMGYVISQDCVQAMWVQGENVVLEIKRYAQGKYESLFDVASFTYHMYIRQIAGQFSFSAVFPTDKDVQYLIPWRNKSGNIACPGDSCSIACDSNCPIWLNTIGLSMLKSKDCNRAIQTFSDALLIAPDFLAAQNNLGSAYGISNQHRRAYDVFKKAHDMNKTDPQALYGLIVSEMHLGMIREAWKHCDKYDRLPNCNSTALRKNMRNPFVNDIPTIKHSDLVAEMLTDGKKNGYVISNGFPHVPELLFGLEQLIDQIRYSLEDYADFHPNIDPFKLSLICSAYAGLGATYHWHVDWNALSRNGIFQTLTIKSGIFKMEEYVLDAIGIPLDTEKGKEFSKHISSVANIAIVNLLMVQEEFNDKDIFEACKAMYMYGMVVELNRLGMI